MKIKDVKRMGIIKEIRYNPNTRGSIAHFSVKKPNPNKQEIGVNAILSLMTLCGFYEEAKDEKNKNNMEQLVNQMIINSEEFVDIKGL